MPNGASGLILLAQERNNILLAEAAAWLHDWQKSIPFWQSLGAQFNPRGVSAILENFKPIAPLIQNQSTSLKEIIEQGRDPSRSKHSTDWRISLLGNCHDVAHIDKPELVGLGETTQLIGSVFGHEVSPSEASQMLLNAVNHIEQRHLFLKELEKAFSQAVGDTRRPINEVTLWDWGSASSALWKAVAARYILENRTDGNLNWRFLSIDFDGLSFLERAPTISDMVGRQDALQAALDAVRELLEVTYPLGNEVYRDENGSAFVVPALDGDDDEGNRLRDLIESNILDTLRQSDLGGELQPRIHITQAHKRAALLHKTLEMPPPPTAPFQDSLRCWWQGEAADICTTCGVRPQGWGAPTSRLKDKAQQRKVCHICLERRGKRAEKWARARHKTGADRKPWERTIWLDEVADENGRLALVVGKFDLTQWLNGNMIQTLLVLDPGNGYKPKNPSFARLQRVWRTTQQFWQSVQDEDIPAVARFNQNRLMIAVTNADELQSRLGKYHVYEAEINSRRLSMVWDSQDQCLLTADNLSAWAKGGAYTLLNQLPEEISLFEPGGYGQQRETRVPAKVDRAGSKVIQVAYSPALGLLAQPASFMALVPAAVAIEVATKINQRYELEMSKVRNRLPLFLGLIFFDRRQPLFSALDAGRRLLKQSFQIQTYTVEYNDPHSHSEAPSHLNHPHFENWREMKLKGQDGESLTWRASTMMGDGKTLDYWYPYVHVIKDKDGNSPTGRRQFEYPENTGLQWIHIQDVKKDDEVHFMPSRFCWLHLDTSARRFEAGQNTQPLEELAYMTSLWKKLQNLAGANKLSESKLHAIVTLLIAKGESWHIGSDQFQQLAEAILNKEGLDTLTIEDITSGRLQATFELYHRILKRRLEEEQA